MQWVSKAVQYYKDINPATLTGAIDVIVVERPTDVPGEVELACSPFHVRFGKLSVLRPVDKKVRITVNEERVPFYMKVGETGEAFFVFETEADVPEDLQTSPLSGPVSDDGRGDAEMEPLDLDAPPPDDEGETDVHEADEDQPKTPPSSQPHSPASSRYASLSGTQLNSPAQTFRSFPPTPFLPGHSPPSSRAGSIDHTASHAPDPDRSEAAEQEEHDKAGAKSASYIPGPIARVVEKAAGLTTVAANGAGHALRDAKLKHDFRKGNGGSGQDLGESRESEHDLKGHEKEHAQVDKEVREDLEGMSLQDRHGSETPPLGTGDEVIQAARERNADVRAILGGPGGTGHASNPDGTPSIHEFSLKPFPTGSAEVSVQHSGKVLRNAAGDEVGVAPEDTGALMLDMSGYKVGKEKEEKEEGVEERLRQEVSPSTLGIDDVAEKEIIGFTQALLQSTDPTTLRNFFDPADEVLSPTDTGIPPLDIDSSLEQPAERKIPTPRSRVNSRASSPPRPVSISSLQSLHAESDIAPSPDDGVFHASPKQFTLKIGGRVHVFELSLCGSEGFGHDQASADRAFVDNQVTFNQFMEQGEVTDHPDLVVKYAGRYLTWDNASPVLASLAVYRKSLIDHPEHHRHVDQTAKRAGRGWSLWWGRKGNENVGGDTGSTVSLPTTETSPPTSPPISPPISPPASPRSMPVAESPPPLSPPTSPQPDDDFPQEDHTKHYAKTLRLTSDQLKALKLNKGMNIISFSVRSSYSGYATCTSRIFLWESDFQVVISDIDGTITKSDALGHVFTMIGRDWTHLGVAKLYTDISRNGYKMMYLTSRAIGQADTTREYLKGIRQNGFQLPEGPVIMSPDRLMTSLHREVIMRKPEVFKMACLRDIQRLFGERSPFYAGFGNRITDALSYRSVAVPSSRIFTIDSNGEVKMELLELAGYKSSYIHMTDLVDQMFPPINRATAPDFTDFNYWRAPLPDIDLPELSPPSPALSARSDQSSSRIPFPRLGSIASSLSRRSSRGTLQDSNGNNRGARAASPSSPLLQATVPEEPVGDESDTDSLYYERHRRSSSMPGSLPDESDFDRYRAEAGRNRQDGTTEAEAYKKKVKGQHIGEDGEEDEEEDDYELGEHDDEEVEGDDFGDQLDFSSVPYL
ncbi:hypothetical protein JCM1840_004158 [Sporobolomyces johnsonii]